MKRLRIALGLTAAASLAARCAGEGVAMPGHADYWVRLASLSVDKGVLDKDFEENVQDYALRIDDVNAPSVNIRIGINMQKYSPLGLPALRVNGTDFKFDPLQGDGNLYKVNLSENLFPYDHVIPIEIYDNVTTGGWFGSTQQGASFKYNIHITQAPPFDKITQAEKLVVYLNKTLIGPSRAWDPTKNEYTYYLNEDQDRVNVSARCLTVATGMRFDGKEIAPDTNVTVMVPRWRKTVDVQCYYDDPKWASHEQDTTYKLEFMRHVDVDLKTLNPMLNMKPADGHCVTRSKGPKPEDRMFVCYAGSPTVTIVAAYDNPKVDAILKGQKDGVEVPLFNGIPTEFTLTRRRQDYALQIWRGEPAPISFPVTIVQAGHCEDFECPEGQVARIATGTTVEVHLCEAEECTDADLPLCCQEGPACTTLDKCPKGQSLRAGAEDVHCSHYECNDDDADTCCGTQATCLTYKCPTGKTLKKGAGRLLCQGLKCNATDTTKCCEVEPPKEDNDFYKKADAKLKFYKSVGCYPNPASTCGDLPCYFDPTCQDLPVPRNGGLGCLAAGVDWRCRFCDVEGYEDCPKPPMCYDPQCASWSEDDAKWCRDTYDYICPGSIWEVLKRDDAPPKVTARAEEAAHSAVGRAFASFGTPLGWLAGLGFVGCLAGALLRQGPERRSCRSGLHIICVPEEEASLSHVVEHVGDGISTFPQSRAPVSVEWLPT